MKKKLRLRTWVIIFFMLVFLSGIVYYSYQIIVWKMHVDDNKRIHDKINENITVIQDAQKEEVQYKIDFDSLKEQNPDTVAFLTVLNTNIDYIVVKGTDNDYYLKHNFEKTWNVAGWIFADYRNLVNGEDQNLVIYGHSTKDGSMFGTLDRVLRPEWYENPDNHRVSLTTEKGTFYYQVFSTYVTVPEEYYIQTSFPDQDSFSQFLNEIKSRSVYPYEVDLTDEDTILTLSSCLNDGRNRVVLHAKKLVEETELEDEVE